MFHPFSLSYFVHCQADNHLYFLYNLLNKITMTSAKLNQSELQMEELQREFDLQEFKVVVGGLLSALQLHISLELRDIYSQIKNKNGVVVGRDILRLLHMLKQQAEAQKQLDDEIHFYKTTVSQLVSRGKNTLTIGEFFVNFVLNNPKKGIVTEQIQSIVSDYKIVSVSKLMGLIQSIQNARSGENRNLKSHIHNELIKQEEDTLDVTLNEVHEIDRLKTIILETCTDQNMSSRAVIMLDSIKRKLLDDLQEMERLDANIKVYETREHKANDQFLRLEQIITEKQNLINKIYQENQKYEEQIQLFEQKCREDFTEAISKLSEENKKLIEEKNMINQNYEDLNRELEWYKSNYLGVSEQYKKFVAQNQLEKERIQIEENNRNFEVMKAEINEIYEKINKLRKENLQLKNKISDLEIELEARIMTSGHQTDRTFANLTLDERIPNQTPSHFHEEAKDTFLQLLRKKPNIEQIESQISKSISQQRNNSIKLIRSVTKQYFSNQMKLSSSNETKDRDDLKMSEQIKQKIDEFDFAGILDSKELKSMSIFLEANCKSPSMLKSLFSTIVYIISSNGRRQKMILALSSDKFLLCSLSPLEAMISMELTRIQQFCFCESIRNWVVVKIKETRPVINTKQTQIVLQVSHRAQLLRYFLKSGFLSSEHNIRISFQKEENIQIRQYGQSLILSTFEGMKSLVESSVNDGENVFEGKIHEYYAFINRKVPVRIFINPIGILVFERRWQSQLENQKLKLILPFSNKMEIIDLSQQNKIKFVYSPTNKSYVLQFESYALTKLAKEKIKNQRHSIAESSKKENEKFLSIFTGFKKMRSIEEQSSVDF